MDSNHDKGLQRALCYRYTIGQCANKLAFLPGTANKILAGANFKLQRNHRRPKVGTKFGAEFFKQFFSGNLRIKERKGC